MRWPPVPDLLIAAAVVALVLVDWSVGLETPPMTPLMLVCGLVSGAALVVRRSWPRAVLTVCAASALTPVLVQRIDPGFYSSFIAFLIAGCTVAALAGTVRRSLWMPATMAVAYAVFAVVLPDFRSLDSMLFTLGVTAVAYAVARLVHALRDRAAVEAQRADLAMREQELAAREAVVAERERIARELHDVIAHEVSVMVIHAAAAQQLVPERSPEVAEALTQVQESGRSAIEELHLLLGMLRGESAERTPQPGLAQLPELVAELRRSGLDVTLETVGTPRPVGGALDVSAYRVVQEALTNALKHAAPCRAVVRLEYRPDDLVLRVCDDGAGRAGSEPPAVGLSGGHGLVGMRERVRMFGGEVEAGRRPDGGWVVTARLPTAVEPREVRVP
ncbi:MAG TPA: sensor histidine kinase [Nocardioides sp.]|nr:sensor histidine kinase [Nocardioides sp.]